MKITRKKQKKSFYSRYRPLSSHSFQLSSSLYHHREWNRWTRIINLMWPFSIYSFFFSSVFVVRQWSLMISGQFNKLSVRYVRFMWPMAWHFHTASTSTDVAPLSLLSLARFLFSYQRKLSPCHEWLIRLVHMSRIANKGRRRRRRHGWMEDTRCIFILYGNGMKLWPHVNIVCVDSRLHSSLVEPSFIRLVFEGEGEREREITRNQTTADESLSTIQISNNQIKKTINKRNFRTVQHGECACVCTGLRINYQHIRNRRIVFINIYIAVILEWNFKSIDIYIIAEPHFSRRMFFWNEKLNCFLSRKRKIRGKNNVETRQWKVCKWSAARVSNYLRNLFMWTQVISKEILVYTNAFS